MGKQTSPRSGTLTHEQYLSAFKSMMRIRSLERYAEEAYRQGHVGGFFHSGIGQEGIVVAAHAVFGNCAWYTGTYRCHGLALTLGESPLSIFAELFGREKGNARGRGGSMHLFSERLLGGFGIVGGQVPISVGAAFSSLKRGKGECSLCFLGDGAVPQGAFHESLNLASLWKLPVLFIIENNEWGMGTSVQRSNCITPLAETKGPAYGIPAYTVNPGHFEECFRCFQSICDSTCGQTHGQWKGPVLVEILTHRFRGHSISDAQPYRTSEEVALLENKQDPLDPIRQHLSDDEIHHIEEEVKTEMKAASKAALALPYPCPSCLEEGVQAPPTHISLPPASGEEVEMEMREAIRMAIDEAMERDERVFVLGEEVAEYNGPYKVTQGLLDRFGAERVFDTPISELGFSGLAVGAAMTGLRPIVEYMSWNFSFVGCDQIISHAAKMYYMSGGRFQVPVVFRGPNGAGAQVSCQHSHCVEAMYALFPGLIIICPNNAYDAKGLLASALLQNSPVLFLEHELLYHKKMNIPADPYLVDIGRARVVRQGDVLTLVSYSRMLDLCVQACEEWEKKKGIAIELIDLRTIKPLDVAALVASVRKTHRCLIVEEGHSFSGVGAEVAFQLQHHCFEDLDAPVARLCQRETPLPYSSVLEEESIPNLKRIHASIEQVLQGIVRGTVGGGR